jgi:hypothetical protein
MNVDQNHHPDSKKLRQELRKLLEKKREQNIALQKIIREMGKVPDDES